MKTVNVPAVFFWAAKKRKRTDHFGGAPKAALAAPRGGVEIFTCVSGKRRPAGFSAKRLSKRKKTAGFAHLYADPSEIYAEDRFLEGEIRNPGFPEERNHIFGGQAPRKLPLCRRVSVIVRSLSAKYRPDRYRRDKSVKFGTELP